ncbi:plasmid fertility inhibition factor family protein [Ralstonia nicotianae]|uniref:plasmid fertility inhibition factor family protein n=1 Tax=Ralstonia pseudosolanacearum TaxID=1310165 RepID=UPI002004E0ED|nr:hypothetical protein [Ralstonia pseudosolanacearum]MCK4118439.1 hypothetical protein [Ralstonia pseudosolanacearum]
MRASERYLVVEVDVARLLDLWRHPQTRRKDLAFADVTTWPKDRKYASVGPCFARAEANPVPLAQVCCWPQPRQRFGKWWTRTISAAEQAGFDFDNGATRAIWLLATGAQVFPIACETDQAPLLFDLACVDGGGYCRADALVRSYRSDEERSVELEEGLALSMQAMRAHTT